MKGFVIGAAAGGGAVAIIVAVLAMSGSIAHISQPQNLVSNGDFSQGLTGWNMEKVSSGNAGGNYPKIGTASDFAGSSNLNIDAPLGADGFAEQSITIPASSSVTLSFRTWGHHDPVTATVSVIDSSGKVNTIGTFDPSCKIDTGCSEPETKSFDLTPFSGQTVKIRFESTSNSGTGTIADFTDVKVTAK